VLTRSLRSLVSLVTWPDRDAGKLHDNARSVQRLEEGQEVEYATDAAFPGTVALTYGYDSTIVAISSVAACRRTGIVVHRRAEAHYCIDTPPYETKLELKPPGCRPVERLLGASHEQPHQLLILLPPLRPVVLLPALDLVGQRSQCTTRPAGQLPALLPAVPAVHPCDVLDQAEPGELRAGALERSPADVEAAFKVGKSGCGLLGRPECQKNSRGRMLLVFVARKEHRNEIGEVINLADATVAEIDLRRFVHRRSPDDGCSSRSRPVPLADTASVSGLPFIISCRSA